MKYIKKFNESDISIYDENWQKFLPSNITVIKGYDDGDHHYTFKKGNIMIHSDMLQITYESVDHGVGHPDTLEFDLYFVRNVATNMIEIDLDITFGDEMVCEFKISPPNKVNLIQSTSFGSKFDPTNTIFALDDKSLHEFIVFLNRFNGGLSLNYSSLDFLRKK